ncbi:hypothetical protein ACQRIT_005358 [Beauveria bassiana]
MGDISSPLGTPVEMAENQEDETLASKLEHGVQNQEPPPTAPPSRRRSSSLRHSSYGYPGTPSSDYFDYGNAGPSPTAESGPFNMAPMTSSLPHGGYQHPSLPGGHQQYGQQTSPPAMQHMPHHPYVGHHPGSVMPGYYLQQPPMHQYYTASAPPGHHGPHQMQGRGNSGYYPVPYLMDHPQSPGYYQQPPQFADHSLQRPDHMMNRQYSQGHIQNEGRGPPRRPSYRTNRSFRDPTSPSAETKRQRQNLVRGPPRKPHQSGHAIWVGNLPPQTELMKLVHHVCELAPGLQSLFLISKSNCAFANFKEDAACVEAQKTIHESKFQTVRLVCRLRKSTPEAAADSPIVIADGTSNPESPTLSNDPLKGNKSPEPETLDYPEAMDVRGDSRNALANAQRDRFFILKSLTHEDLVQSVKTSVWATQSHNEQLLNNAFKTTDNVYLVFSANKSGEYFGFARMTSAINQDPNAAIQFAPQNQTASESDQPQPVTIEAKDNIPKGHVIDDSARGTMFWEIEESETEGDIEDDNEVMSYKGADDADEDLQTRGKPFNLQWLSTIPLPFYRTRGLRNPWNSNREVKIARDGTELEPSIGRRLVGLMNINLNPGRPPHPLNDPRGFNAFIASGRRP